MLKHFKVENSYSYSQPVTLDFSADFAKKDLWQLVRETHGGHFLPVVALYGSNAGGKSNLCRAIEDFIVNILTRHDSFYGNRPTPFLLAGRRSPYIQHEACFSFTDASGNMLEYEYGYSFKDKPFNISRECMKIRTPGRAEHAGFVREGADIEFIGSYANDNRNLLISVAKDTSTLLVNALGPANIRYGISEIFDWCRRAECIISVPGDIEMNYDSVRLAQNVAAYSDYRERLSTFVTRFDSSVAHVGAALTSFEESENPWENDYELVTSHPVRFAEGLKHVGIPYHMLSNGTKKLFHLFESVSRCLDGGGFLVIDELDTMLHPVIFRKIVGTFNDPITNSNNAQLVFAAHNTIVLNREDLRRDQIVIVDKDEAGRSSIKRLSDMTDEFGKPIRSDLRYDKVYLTGLLGSFPYDFDKAAFNEGGER